MTQNNEERRPVHQPNGVNENSSLPSSIGQRPPYRGMLPAVSGAVRVDISRAQDHERVLFDATADAPAGAILVIVVNGKEAQPFERDTSHLFKFRDITFRAAGFNLAWWSRYLNAALLRDSRGGGYEPLARLPW